MTLTDQLRFNSQIFLRHRVRSGLILLAVAIGVAAVVLLTGLGEGARRYVDREFEALGSQLLIILPGKKETTGGLPPMFGTTPRDLTLEDAQALAQIPTVKAIAPVIAGTALAAYGNRSREVITMGSTPGMFVVRKLPLAQGQGFSKVTENHAQPVVVLGSKLKDELFGDQPAIGEWLRLGDRRFRVIGVLAERGESLGLDLRDLALIPVRSAEQLFNSPGLFRVMLEIDSTRNYAYTERRIRDIIRERHEGEDDVTVISQDSMLSAFNDIINTLTIVVGVIASISLVVAGILIMNVSLISVSQRREEIGLLKALGASAREVRGLFLGESLILVSLGSAAGLLSAVGLLSFVRSLYPSVPLAAPWWAMVAGVTVALTSGLIFSWWPAQRAARLDPVLALRGER